MQMDQLDGEQRKMLEIDMEWLNAHHKANGDDDLEVKYEDYFVLDFDFPDGRHFHQDDPPNVMLDIRTRRDDGIRIVSMRVTPYHDEGGPATLTGCFDWNDQALTWELSWVMREFDTIPDLIWADGEFRSLPESENA